MRTPRNRDSSPPTRRGSVMVMTAAAAFLVVAMLAIGVDLGWVMYQRAKNQTAVNAGWKAGYDLMALRLRTTPGDITSETHAASRQQIITRVNETMLANGLASSELAKVQIIFKSPNKLEVIGTRDVGLFFGNMLASGPAHVTSLRGNTAGESYAHIIPLAIPHGVVKDLSKNTYNVDFFSTGEQFTVDKEYILKLGSGGGNDTVDPQMILIPMDVGGQSTANSNQAFKRAYGLVYWCLADPKNPNDSGYAPCYWLVGYRNGSFLLPYDDAVVAACTKFGVSKTIVTGQANIDAIFDAVPNGCLIELKNRPLVSVLSSQPDPDPVENALRQAWIPYGTYNPSRTDNYTAANNTVLTAETVIGGGLTNYNWIHLHHEDFTGHCTGCNNYPKNCRTYMRGGGFGSTYNDSAAKRAAAKELMCPWCKSKYANTGTSWNTDNYPTAANYGNIYNVASSTGNGYNCANWMRRCVDRKTANGTLYCNHASTKDRMCYDNSNRPKCREWNDMYTEATGLNYDDDAGAFPKPQRIVDGTSVISLTDADYWVKRTRVQKMMQDVCLKVKEHISQGGYMFAMCFALETYDLALFQEAISRGKSANQAYNETLAFEDFTYKRFPNDNGSVQYSSINVAEQTTSQGWTITGKTSGGKYIDPRCQTHVYSTDTGLGYTASINKNNFKTRNDSDTILGVRPTATSLRYVKGEYGTGNAPGEFAMLGGHCFGSWENYTDIAAIRCVLNNVLLGSLSEKPIITDVETKQKENYGIIDPDNVVAGGADDYRDRFEYGYTGPLDLGYRILTEPGNKEGPTDQSVAFRLAQELLATGSRKVIVPITDIPPEVTANSDKNATATSIYDLSGLDHSGGLYLPSEYGFEASVRIIGFAEFELLDPTAATGTELAFTRAGGTIVEGDSGDLGPYQTGQVRGKFIRYIVNPWETPVPF